MSSSSDQHKCQNFLEFLTILKNNQISYGVFKSSRNIEASISSKTDLDLLVDQSCLADFFELARSYGAIHGEVVAPLRSPDRCDVLLPLTDGSYIHMDVHTSICLGHKFAKRIHGIEFDDLVFLEATVNRGHVKVVRPLDEVSLAIIREFFKRPFGWFVGRPVVFSRNISEELSQLFFFRR